MWQKVKQIGIPALAMLVIGIFIGFGIAAPARTVVGQSAADTETDLLKSIYTRVNPSVVSIQVRIPGQTSLRSGSQQQFSYAAGSGFLYDNKGHIVTNAHVVAGADKVEISLSDYTMMYAKVVGLDLDSDIAVIQAEGDLSKLTPLTLADSDALAVGDRAIAIGNPFEKAGTMTQGIISGLHRSVDGLASFKNSTYQIPDAIQTDAAINPGNSGGPLLNNQGQVIGVAEQIESQVRQSSGVSFAIPANLVKQVADGLIADGKVDHTWLGISGTSLVLDVNEALGLPGDTVGAYVEAVDPSSPASKAGLRGGRSTVSINGGNIATGGDIIVAIDGHPVRRFDDLTGYLFSKTKVGQTVTITIVRDGKQQDIQITLTSRPHSTDTGNDLVSP